MLDPSYKHSDLISKLKNAKNKTFFLIKVSENRKNGVKNFFGKFFERFYILKMLKYIRQMKDEIKCR